MMGLSAIIWMAPVASAICSAVPRFSSVFLQRRPERVRINWLRCGQYIDVIKCWWYLIGGNKGMEGKIKCGSDCCCWRRCNYCRFSEMINYTEGKYPTFICKNEQHPMCHHGEGFECINFYIPENCIGNIKKTEEWLWNQEEHYKI